VFSTTQRRDRTAACIKLLWVCFESACHLHRCCWIACTEQILQQGLRMGTALGRRREGQLLGTMLQGIYSR
jgi:hypothetical protein